jgi:hypothetical protein
MLPRAASKLALEPEKKVDTLVEEEEENVLAAAKAVAAPAAAEGLCGVVAAAALAFFAAERRVSCGETGAEAEEEEAEDMLSKGNPRTKSQLGSGHEAEKVRPPLPPLEQQPSSTYIRGNSCPGAALGHSVGPSPRSEKGG